MGKVEDLDIIVPIKQVPETGNVRMDEETGTMIREGVESIVNPLDLYAIEIGVQLKERYGGKVVALTMGLPSAERALKEALAMGCDQAVLVTGPEFAGSDTWATSFTLSRAIDRVGRYDLVIAGERATDGDTGQVGPGIASFLDIPLGAYVSRIISIEDGRISVERLIEEGYETLRLTLPALLTVVKEISYPRLPTLRGKQRARGADIPRWSAQSLNIQKEEVGLKGSPTRVERIFSPQVARGGRILKVRDEEDAIRAVHALIEFLGEKNLL
jgi:electron transfer flavoprotein beta subunit